MIKELLPAILLIATVGVMDSSAQICTANTSCVPNGTDYGICPDSTTGLASGTVGVAYSQSLSILTPSTGGHWGVSSATIDSLVVTGVDSLAPGLTYQCLSPSCKFVPGSSCLVISGTPTQTWNHTITVHITPYVYYFASHFAYTPQTNKQYRSVVNAPTGIETLDLSAFEVEQNIPNPFNGKSEIHYSSTTPATIEFRVYNMLGAIVYSNKYKAEKGMNTIGLEANTFSPGIYMYSIKNGTTAITKRMIVSNE
jgi:hypothetical protein